MSNLVMDLFIQTSNTAMLMDDSEDGFRGETSVATYVLKVLGVAFICIAEMTQVIKIMRSKKKSFNCILCFEIICFLIFRNTIFYGCSIW